MVLVVFVELTHRGDSSTTISSMVNYSNFNDTILKFFEKYQHSFSKVFIFYNMYPDSRGFVADQNLEQFRLPSLIIRQK